MTRLALFALSLALILPACSSSTAPATPAASPGVAQPGPTGTWTTPDYGPSWQPARTSGSTMPAAQPAMPAAQPVPPAAPAAPASCGGSGGCGGGGACG